MYVLLLTHTKLANMQCLPLYAGGGYDIFSHLAVPPAYYTYDPL